MADVPGDPQTPLRLKRLCTQSTLCLIVANKTQQTKYPAKTTPDSPFLSLSLTLSLSLSKFISIDIQRLNARDPSDAGRWNSVLDALSRGAGFQQPKLATPSVTLLPGKSWFLTKIGMMLPGNREHLGRLMMYGMR